jgi:hypothetical protein
LRSIILSTEQTINMQNNHANQLIANEDRKLTGAAVPVRSSFTPLRRWKQAAEISSFSASLQY